MGINFALVFGGFIRVRGGGVRLAFYLLSLIIALLRILN